jgi:tetratricopeptide (TPR) repeat protein
MTPSINQTGIFNKQNINKTDIIQKDNRSIDQSDHGETRSNHKTWLDRFTDESNLWLNAIRLNEIGDYKEAYDLYIQDAEFQLIRGTILQAALSYFCAAECMMEMGNKQNADSLYAKAADLYLRNVENSIKYSMAEAVWSLQRAYESFILANDTTNARQIYRLLIFMNSKINPFGSARPTKNHNSY